MLYFSGVSLNVPAGMWGKQQYTAVEVCTSRKISRARIHVERSIGYIKRYKILKNRVPCNMLPYLSNFFFVCAQLVNLSPVYMREIDDLFKNNLEIE